MNEQFNEQQKEVLQLLKALEDNDILPHVILAGSWAEYAYAQSGLLPGFTLNLRTIDVDFLIKNLRRPTEPISLPTIMNAKGYSIEHDVLMETTKLISPGGLEIEFLIPQKGRGTNPILKTNLGVNAQALRHMDKIIDNAVTVDLLGIKVQVPCPESYVLHKMIINDVRKGIKKEKDRNSIVQLLPYINLEKVTELCAAFTKNEKKRVRAFVEQYAEGINAELRLDTKIKFMKFVSSTFPDIYSSDKDLQEKNIKQEHTL